MKETPQPIYDIIANAILSASLSDPPVPYTSCKNINDTLTKQSIFLLTQLSNIHLTIMIVIHFNKRNRKHA